jgi:iron complex outermembrane receptor protein
MTHNKLLAAVRCALYAGVVSAVFTGVPAYAQSSGSETSTDKLDTIVVTGSRIRKIDIETEAPVVTITRADIEKQGFQSISDILQNVPAMGTPTISRASPLSAGENAGGTYISMRNLGAQRTLILLNGKRLGISTSGLSDISTIPTAAVERIEVLKDGASAIYGSDAIAGVVNIITRSNYNGAAGSVYYGQYDQDDGAITKGDFVMGFGSDRGSLTVAAEWTKEDAVRARDRDFSAYPQSDLHPDRGWTAAGQYGGFAPCSRGNTAIAPVCYIPGVAAGRYILRDGGNPYDSSHYRLQNTSTESPADKSNTNQQTDLRTPLENKSLYVDGSYKITDEIRFRTNVLYSNRLSSRTVAGYPMQASGFPQTAIGMSVDSYYNPFGSWHAPAGSTPQALGNWWRRSWEVPRVTDSELDTYRFSGAFEGVFEIGDRYFNWDVGYLNNQNKLLQKTFGNWNLARTQAAVGPSFLNAAGRVQCGTTLNPIGFDVCVPFNPFLQYGLEGDGGLYNNEELQKYLFQTEHNSGRTKTVVYTANLSGNIFTLPAGDLGFAVGYEHRNEHGAFTPDALAATAGSTNLASNPTSGGYKVDEVYLELQVPILADLPFAKELSLDVATRSSDYDTFGDTINSKVGFKWKPMDSLLIRGTWAEGFRAPTIADLYGGGSQTFATYTDPCDVQFGASRDAASATRARCRQDLGALADTFRQLGQGFLPVTSAGTQTPVAFFSSSGNPDLVPELSKSKTLGAVYSPSFVEGLNIALDWWEIKINQTIVQDSPGGILNDCYTQGIQERCFGFTRDSALGYVNTFRYGNRNAGYREVEGFDLDVTYRLPTDSWGAFSFAWNTTYTSRDEFVTQNNPLITHPEQNVSYGSAFRIRSNLNVGWELGDFGVSWNTRYYSAMKETCLNATLFPDECSNPGTYIPDLLGRPTLRNINVSGATAFHDIQFRWKAPWDATVSVGANNVFEKYGPIMYTQPSANVSYYGGFDIGRFWYARYTQRF